MTLDNSKEDSGKIIMESMSTNQSKIIEYLYTEGSRSIDSDVKVFFRKMPEKLGVSTASARSSLNLLIKKGFVSRIGGCTGPSGWGKYKISSIDIIEFLHKSMG